MAGAVSRMGIKRRIKKKIEEITGIYIFRDPPFGVCVINDIAHRFPGYKIETIFDVGANIGQSALKYVSKYPSSTIYCFEPITATYKQLKQAVNKHSRVHCFNLALGNTSGLGTMISDGVSTMNSLLQEGDERDTSLTEDETESVRLTTLDEFCNEHNIDNISYLKVDTEGGDLNVLKGSREFLKEGRVDFVEIEAGMNPTNNHHVPIESLKSSLEEYGYFIFGIYEQQAEWIEKKPHLRRSNIIFISPKIIQEYSR